VKHSAIRNRVAAVVLGSMLITPGAWAAETKAGRILELASTPKVFVLGIWNQLTALWAEDGSFIDPNGGRAASPDTPPAAGGDLGEAGSFVDPNG